MKAKVSIVVPCRNEEAHLSRCIDSLLSTDYGSENIEILIVDGRSTDGSREIIEKYSALHSSVRLIDNPDQITPIAFNKGIKNSTGDYILIVGARHILSENYISVCVDMLKNDPSCGCVGGMVENIFENEKSRVIAMAMASPFGVGGGNFRTRKADGYVDTVGTPCYRKSLFKEIGYFDEELIRNQDDEFNFRLTKAGYKIFFSAAISIRYFVRADFQKLFRQYFQYGYWKVYVNRKHKTVTSIRQLVPFLFMLFLSVFIPLSLFSGLAGVVTDSVILLYVLIVALISVRMASSIQTFAYAVASFFCLHFGYGLGYYQGIVHFLVLNRKPVKAAGHLTR